MNFRRATRRCIPAWGLAAGLLTGCLPVDPATDTDAQRGQLLLEQYDCGNCHIIPGVRRAQGRMGPTLQSYAHRAYIAGELPNQREVLVRWIGHPSALVPDTLMPDQGVPDAHARDMSAYLMDLR